MTPGTTAIDAFEAVLHGAPGRLVGPAQLCGRLAVSRWRGSADAGDRAVLAHCAAPTIDLGCGPGRMAQQLAHHGVDVLGVDLSAAAVAQARARGVRVVRADVLGPLPGEGGWRCALLADGNIGIGGDPVRLLRRARRLLGPGGRVVVDLAGSGVGLVTGVVHLRTSATTTGPFPWAVLGPGAVHRVARQAQLAVNGVHHVEDRWFAVLTREPAGTAAGTSAWRG